MVKQNIIFYNMLYHFDIDISYQSLKDDEIYQHQFLNAFGMNEFDEKVWRKVFDELYERIMDNSVICDIVHYKCQALKIPFSKGKERNYFEMGLIFLFSYEYFEIFHRVLQEWNSGSLNEDSIHIQDLKSKIDKSQD
jgi:hypothetical protein